VLEPLNISYIEWSYEGFDCGFVNSIREEHSEKHEKNCDLITSCGAPAAFGYERWVLEKYLKKHSLS
jgi:hypothetical protein